MPLSVVSGIFVTTLYRLLLPFKTKTNIQHVRDMHQLHLNWTRLTKPTLLTNAHFSQDFKSCFNAKFTIQNTLYASLLLQNYNIIIPKSRGNYKQLIILRVFLRITYTAVIHKVKISPRFCSAKLELLRQAGVWLLLGTDYVKSKWI